MGDKINKLNDVITELETQTDDIKNFTEILKKIEQIGNEAVKLDEKVNKNVESYIATADMMKKSAELLDSRLDALEALIRQDIHSLYKDNQNYQKELDDSIRTRIEKFKDNIEINTRKQLTDIENKIVNLVNEKTSSIDKKLDDVNQRLSSFLEAFEKEKNKSFLSKLIN